MHIREAGKADLEDTLAVERAAFGSEEEADLVAALLTDPSARPLLSLLALDGDRAVGHILFTAAQLTGSPMPVRSALLAPMAVLPDRQKQGLGGKLIAEGLKRLGETGTELVFVLGHPTFYPRSGFEPAGRLGFDAPYPIEDKNADAWMVQALRPGIIGTTYGTVACADAIDRAEYWVE